MYQNTFMNAVTETLNKANVPDWWLHITPNKNL